MLSPRRVLMAAFTSASLFAQQAGISSRPDESTIPKYEIVSIHPSDPRTDAYQWNETESGVVIRRTDLRTLLAGAYGFRMGLLREQEVINPPTWYRSDAFDVDAKVEDDQVEHFEKLVKADNDAVQVRELSQRMPTVRMLMMQRLLADRFHLRLHFEQRSMPVYALVVAKSGLKIKPVPPSDMMIDFSFKNGRFTAAHAPLSFLFYGIAWELDRPLIDLTGDKESYDLSLQWTKNAGMNAGMSDAGAAETGPSVFTALHDQLGLELKATKAPVWVLVIDHVEHPSEN